MQRIYSIQRSNIQAALALMPELQTVVGYNPIMAVLPTVAANMEEMVITYYFDSVEHFSCWSDGRSGRHEFQQIVTKASSFGTLKRSRVMVTID